MTSLQMIRLATVMLGLFGIPFALALVQLSSETMRTADRRAVRQMARLFFWLTIGIAVVLLGHAAVSLGLLLACAEQSLWPAVVQIASMIVFDGALVGMFSMTKAVEQEKPRRERGEGSCDAS